MAHVTLPEDVKKWKQERFDFLMNSGTSIQLEVMPEKGDKAEYLDHKWVFTSASGKVRVVYEREVASLATETAEVISPEDMKKLVDDRKAQLERERRVLAGVHTL